jgi:hypothetical protein
MLQQDDGWEEEGFFYRNFLFVSFWSLKTASPVSIFPVVLQHAKEALLRPGDKQGGRIGCRFVPANRLAIKLLVKFIDKLIASQ